MSPQTLTIMPTPRDEVASHARRVFLRNSSFGFCALSGVGFARPAWAHHGWSSFDEAAPIYLEGTVQTVRWQNPHAEIVLNVSTQAALPTDLLSRKLPPQQANVDTEGILKKTRLPKHIGAWEIEFAPLSRMNAWQIEAIKQGTKLAVIGYTFADEKPDSKGQRVLRVEFLFLGPQAYSIRSSPRG